MVTLPLFNQGLTTGTRELTHAPWIAVVLWLTLFSGCWMMLWFHHERIKAVLISGAIGLVVTMVFVTMSAPDLALTQITVDVVTTVLLLMSLSLLPQLTPYESRRSRRWRDALAIIGGLGIGWITWLILTRDHNSISWFFAQQSLPLGGGSNIVNVILVDFRGFDTFGEITVLGIAAIGALCLMDGMRVHGTTMTQGLTYRFNPSPLMFRITASCVTFSIGRKCLYLYAWTQLPGWWLYCRSNYLNGTDYSVHCFRSRSSRTNVKSTIRSSLRNLDWLRINNCRPYWHCRMVLGTSILNQCARLC